MRANNAMYIRTHRTKKVISFGFLPSLRSWSPNRRLITKTIIMGKKTNDRYNNINNSFLLANYNKYMLRRAYTASTYCRVFSNVEWATCMSASISAARSVLNVPAYSNFTASTKFASVIPCSSGPTSM